MANGTKDQKKAPRTWAERAKDAGVQMAGKEPTKEERQAITGHEKRERFVTLAPKRVNNALTSLNRVENLANKASYTFTPEEAEKVVSALNAAIQSVAASFKRSIEGRGAEQTGFTL